MLTSLFPLLLGLGSAGMFTGGVFFALMTIRLNKVLPSEKRIRLVTYRYHISEIKRLHEEYFPNSTLRATYYLLVIVSVLLLALGTIVGIAK